MTRVLATLGVMLLACGREEAADRAEPVAADVGMDDSLLVTINDSTQIWLTSGMVDTGSAGEICHERTLEIRRRDTILPVPLLYTTGVEVENDSTLRAPLVRDCAPVDTYLVNLHTGLPRRAE